MWKKTGNDTYDYLLQVKSGPPTQDPFHFLGGGPKPLSLNDSEVGSAPESMTPIIVLLSTVGLRLAVLGNPRKSHDLVVCTCKVCLGNTENTSFFTAIHQKKEIFYVREIDLSITCSIIMINIEQYPQRIGNY